jgi:hypothetical protein
MLGSSGTPSSYNHPSLFSSFFSKQTYVQIRILAGDFYVFSLQACKAKRPLGREPSEGPVGTGEIFESLVHRQNAAF